MARKAAQAKAAAKRRYLAMNRRAAQKVDLMLKWAAEQDLYGGYDPEEHMRDLMTDIRHWCQRHHEDYYVLDRTAYEHYAAELVQARTGVEQ